MPLLSILSILLIACLGSWGYAHAETPARPRLEDSAEIQGLRARKSAVESEVEKAKAEADALQEELKKRDEAVAEATRRLKEIEALIDAKTKDLGHTPQP